MSKIPTEQELQQYLADKGVEDILTSMIESICVNRPDDVPTFMVDYLHNNYPIVTKYQQKQRKKPDSQIDYNISTTTNKFKFGSGHSDEDKSDEEDTFIDTEVSENIRRRYSISTIRRKAFSSEPIDIKDLQDYKKVKIEKTESERKRLEQTLSTLPLFKHYDKEDMESLYDAMFAKNFDTGDVIIKQGDKGDYFYVVDSGYCEIYVEKDGKQPQLVKTVGPGDYFGELALIYGTPRAATVKAVTPVKLWAIDRMTYRKIIMGQTLKKRSMYENFLKKVPLFESLTDYERLTIADALQSSNFKKGDVIIKQGDPGDTFYIIVEGECVVTKSEDNGPAREVLRLKPGDYFGELALLFNQPRAATVTAVQDVRTVSLDRKSFNMLLGPCEDILKRNTATYRNYMAKI